MEALKVLIADDNDGIRLVMKKIVEKAEGFSVCAEAANGEEALALFSRFKPDVVILDVEMEPMNGVDCAREIADLDPRVFIIFATAHEHYRKEAFEVYAFDYLVKPFRVERAEETLNKIRETVALRHAPVQHTAEIPKTGVKKLMVRHKDGISLIEPSEIILIQREERSTVIITVSGGRVATSETLSEIHDRLDKNVFIRSHKSYIINLTMVYEVFPYGRWTYIAKLKNTDLDALITHDKFEEIEQMLLNG
jgi:two-component system, LytTR family, response regulator